MNEKVLNKIDFDLLVSVSYANPNGDPLNGNRPRTDYNDFGEISDVCIKRKIRNRMQDLGYKEFHSKLIPNISPDKVIGIRTPDLRAFAKKVRKSKRFFFISS